MKSDHATVKINNMDIPLIGIPTMGSQETCDICGNNEVHIQDIEFDGKFKCPDCKNTQKS